MKKESIDYSVRKAKENFDKWNEVSGMFEPCSGSYSEIMGIIEDSAHIGIQMALKNKILRDDDGNIKYND